MSRPRSTTPLPAPLRLYLRLFPAKKPTMLRPAPPRLGALLFDGLVVLLLAALVGALFIPTLGQPLVAEDGFWIRGDVFGNNWRLTAHWLLHRVCVPLFHEKVQLYRLPSYALHLGCSTLIYVFFLNFFGMLQTSLRRSSAQLRLGGLLAALAFVFLDRGTMGYLSALSYQLAVFFGLAMLIGALHYLRTGRTLAWLLAVASYTCAIFSHSYAFPLPFFVLLLELSVRRSNTCFFNPLMTALRYTALVTPLVVLATLFWHDIVTRTNATPPTADMLLDMAQTFGKYLLLTAVGFRQHLVDPYGENGGQEWLALGLAAILVAGGVWSLWGKTRNAGPAAALALFFVAWSGVSFLQEMSAPNRCSYWRFYFNAAGLALGGAFVSVWLIEGAARLTRLSRPLIWTIIVMLALPTTVARGQAMYTGHVAQALTQMRRQADRDRARPRRCAERSALDRDQLEAALRQGKSLTCTHLVGLDLSGMDLSGADLRGANMAGVRMQQTKLRGARLDGAVLVWAHMAFARLYGASLRGADLSGADLSSADLRQSDLSGAQLRWGYAMRVRLARATLGKADLTQADLSDADLSGVDLSETTLVDVTLQRSNLTGARLPNPLPHTANVREAIGL